MALWKIDFIDHNETILGTVAPENLGFVLNIDEPHTIDFEVSTHNPVAALFRGSAPRAGPYQTDWRLKRDNFKVAQGILTRATGAGGSEFFSCSGQGYLHYLDRRVLPFDMAYTATISTNRNFVSGYYYAWDVNVHHIVTDMLNRLQNVDTWCLDYTLNLDNVPKKLMIYISEPADSETVYSKIKALSEMMYNDGGFDFELDKNKVFRLHYPEKGDHNNPVLTLLVNSYGDIAATDITFTNDGPGATHVIGSASSMLPVNRDFPASSAKYRRLDKVEDLGDNIKSPDQLDSRTSSELSLNANPVHEIPITVNANEIPGFWTDVTPGEYIWVGYDLGWHHVDSAQKIVSMDCAITNEGDESVSFGLNQWQDRSIYAGYNTP